MDTTHRSSRRIAFVKQPRLIKSWKITSHGNGIFAVNMNGMWAQNASWVRSHSVDNAGQGFQVDLGMHNFSNGYTE